MRVRQLVPTKFATTYGTAEDGDKVTTWWMWVGKCFKIKHSIISHGPR